MRAPVLLGVTLAALVVLAPASARPTDNDVSVQVGLGTLGTLESRTTTVTPDFSLSVIVAGSAVAPITVTITLPTGLRWIAPPSAAEGCSTTDKAVCTGSLKSEALGGTFAFWAWRVHADQPGTCAITGSVTAADPDPDLSNNATTFTLQVLASPGGGGGGGGASVSASSVKLSPRSPKAGSAVVASVRVTRGGSPLRPSRVACSATVGKTKVKGGPKAASGVASCLFKTPAGAKGKTLAGSVSFGAGGQRFTKRFSAKLR